VRLVFLCVANSARSQIGEVIARSVGPADTVAHSAGSEPSRVNPLAVEALKEKGYDVRGLRSKGLDDVPLAAADVAVTLCAEERCPIIPDGPRHIHHPLPDPHSLEDFRGVVRALESWIPQLFA
jgi:arsenate reductase